MNVLPNIRFPTMEHQKLAIEVRNSGLLAPEELTDLFAYCLSGGKIESKFPSKPRLHPQQSALKSPSNTTATSSNNIPRYTLSTSAHGQKSTGSTTSSRHSSLNKSISRSLTESHHKNSNNNEGSVEGVTKSDTEPGCDVNQGKLHVVEGDLYVKENMPPPSRRARSVVPTVTNKARYSH